MGKNLVGFNDVESRAGVNSQAVLGIHSTESNSGWNWTHHAQQWLKGGAAVLGTAVFGGLTYLASGGLRRNANVVDNTLGKNTDGAVSVKVDGMSNIVATSSVVSSPATIITNSELISPSPTPAKVDLSLEYIGLKEAAKKRSDKDEKANIAAPSITASSVTKNSMQNSGNFPRSVLGGIEVSPWAYNSQGNAKVAMFQDGKFVVAWQQQSTADSSVRKILAQRFDSANNKLGSWIQVNTYTDGTQQAPSVATFTDNSFVVVWQSYGQVSLSDIFGRRFNANGDPLGAPFQINTYASDWENSSSVIALADNKFVVVWSSYDGHDGYGAGIFGQRFNSDGSPLGSEFQVNTYTVNNQEYPVVAALNSNKFIVAWRSYAQIGQDESSYGIFAQRFDANGNKLGSEFRVNTDTVGSQVKPSIATFSDDKFAIAWLTESGSNAGAYAQKYNADGSPSGTEYKIYDMADTLTTSGGYNNNFLTAWIDDGYFFQGKYTSIGSSTPSSFYIVNSSDPGADKFDEIQYDEPALSNVANNKFVIVWTRIHRADWASDIYAKVLTMPQPPTWVNNQLIINEAQSLIVTSAMLSASAEATGFSVSNVKRGQFQNAGTAVIYFTPQEITSGQIRFVHDGSEVAPSYTISVYNNYFSLPAVAGGINFTNVNAAPAIMNNCLTVAKGQSIALTGAMLSARDQDSADIDLTFTIAGLQQGQFESVDNPGVAITTFNQQQIFQGKIKFIHDGTELAPIYSVTVSDGVSSTEASVATINFLPTAISPTIFPSVVELSSLNGLNGFRLDGEAAGDNSGVSVSYAGDVNGDGTSDLIIGANKASSPTIAGAGKSYVLFGSNSTRAAAIELSSLNGTNGFKIYGNYENDELGTMVSFAGDVNKDGVSDIIIGAPGRQNGMGISYVIFGKSTAWTEVLTDNLDNYLSDGAKGVYSPGCCFAARAGNAVGYIGDVNKDGVDDILTGTYLAPSTSDGRGKVNVIFGNRFGWTSGFVYSGNGKGFDISGEAANDFSGFSVRGVGDVNWDGIDDFVIGAYGADPAGKESAGKSYVIFGRKFWSNYDAVDLASLNGVDGCKINGISSGDQSGYVVSPVGDINGDGIPDLAIGAPKVGFTGKVDAGATYVVFGKRNVWPSSIELSALDGTNGFQIKGEAEGDNSGFSVSSAGDVNNDGINDLIIGAPNSDSGGTAFQGGRSYVVFGKKDVWASSLELSSLNGTNGFKINGVGVGSKSGISVGSGDFNNDGISDIVIGAPYTTFTEKATTGATYVIFGDASPVLLTNNLNIIQGQRIVINPQNLSATDANEADQNQLKFTVVNAQHGKFNFVDSPAIAITQFTQQQVNQNIVCFTHDGSTTAPTFSIAVTGSGIASQLAAQPASVGFSLNVAPTIDNNHLVLNQGQAFILTNSMLHAADSDTTDENLVFTISNMQHGKFEFISDPGTAITSFTQAQITAETVRFTHDGSQNAPSYAVAVSDGVVTTGPTAATIDFNVAPYVSNPIATQIACCTAGVGEAYSFSFASNTFTDSDYDALTCTATRSSGSILPAWLSLIPGTRQLSGTPLSASDIGNLEVKVTATDPHSASISDPFTLIVRNTLSASNIKTGITYKTGTDFDLADIVITTPSDTAGVQLTLSDPKAGKFTIDTSGSVASTYDAGTGVWEAAGAKADVNILLAKLKYIPAASYSDPFSLTIHISDGYGQSLDSVINAVCEKPAPQSNSDTGNTTSIVKNAIISGSVTGVVGLIFLVLKIYLGHKATQKLEKSAQGYKDSVQKKQEEFERNVLQPVAKRLREEIKITGFMGYISDSTVKDYVAAVIALIKELNHQGINIDLNSMNSLEQSALLTEIAKQTRHLLVPDHGICSCAPVITFFKPEVKPEDIQKNVKAIASAVKKALMRQDTQMSLKTSVELNDINQGAEEDYATPTNV